jgi:glutaredoxin-related protein
VDVIADTSNVREWIKEYSGWKTIPQLFINGEIIGGLDIVKELIDDGEFAGMIPNECKLGDLKAEMESIIAEEDIILIKSSDAEFKSDACEYSKQTDKNLQMKALIFRSFDIETKPELIPYLDQITGGKPLPLLFYKQSVLKGGLELLEFSKGEDLTKHFEEKYFRNDVFG